MSVIITIAVFARRGCAGQGTGEIFDSEAEWHCNGNESRLLDCSRTQVREPCDHRRDAGVYCSGITLL